MRNRCNSSKYKQVIGNSLNINLQDICESEVRVDIVVKSVNYIRLWGQVRNRCGEPIKNALVKLVRVVCGCHGKHFEGVANTITDCEGFYQFSIFRDDFSYKIIVGKSQVGKEIIINDKECNCNLCNKKPECREDEFVNDNYYDESDDYYLTDNYYSRN